MRRAIAYTGVLLAAIIAVVRLLEKPLYAGFDSYAYLQGLGTDPLAAFLLQAGLLIALLGMSAHAVGRLRLSEESVLVLIASPAVITSLVTAGPQVLLGAIGIIMALFWDVEWAVIIAGVAAVIIDPAGILLLLVGLGLCVMRRRWALSVLSGLASIAGLWYQGLPAIALPGLAELGILGGASVFILLLAVAGFFLWWSQDTYPYLLFALFAIGVGVFIPALSMVVAILLAVIAGHALDVLSSRDWELNSVQTASILLVICGLLFTAASTGAQAARAEPGSDLLDATAFLRGTSAEQVLVPPELAPVLAWYDVPAVSGEQWKHANAGRDLDAIKPDLPRFILLHPDAEAENLLFLIENSNGFVLVRSGTYTVWEVTDG